MSGKEHEKEGKREMNVKQREGEKQYENEVNNIF